MRRIVGAVICLVCAFAMSVQAGVVYSQPLLLPPFQAWVSDPSNPIPYQAYDDFVLPTGIAITDVHWWGGYFYSNTPPALDAFTISFYADAAGAPGAPLANYNAGSVNRSDTGIDTSGYTSGIGHEMDVYYYSYNLPASLALPPSGLYWLSILNNTPGNANDEWCWFVGTNGNGTHWITYPGTSSGTAYDLAFELTDDIIDGNAVPEPISAALFVGSVLLGLGRLRRRLS